MVRVGGRIAVDTVDRFARTLGSAAAAAPQTAGMIADLPGVRSLGSHGVAVLNAAAGHGRDVGYPLVLVAPPGSTAARTLALATAGPRGHLRRTRPDRRDLFPLVDVIDEHGVDVVIGHPVQAVRRSTSATACGVVCTGPAPGDRKEPPDVSKASAKQREYLGNRPAIGAAEDRVGVIDLCPRCCRSTPPGGRERRSLLRNVDAVASA